jgi:hypothetical protein
MVEYGPHGDLEALALRERSVSQREEAERSSLLEQQQQKQQQVLGCSDLLELVLGFPPHPRPLHGAPALTKRFARRLTLPCMRS